MRIIKQSSTQRSLIFLMVDSTDHVTGKTGLTPTVTLSKAGGSFASPSGAVTEIANGLYKVAANATDCNTLGSLWLHATGTAADPVDMEFEVVAYDPQTAALGALMPTVAGRTLDVSAGGEAGVDWSNVGGQSTSVNLSATTTNLVNTLTTYTGNTVQTGDSYARIGAAGAGLTNIVLPSGGLANITAWTVNITGSLSGAVGSVTGAVGSVTGLTAADVAAIKTKTDQLTFTVTNRVDASGDVTFMG